MPVERDGRLALRPEIAEWRAFLRTHLEEILNACAKDTGRSSEECFLVEWSSVDSAFEFLQESVEGLFQPEARSSAMKKILGMRSVYVRRIPVGHVLVVGTWNFPLALHLVQILFARAAGNKVSFKPSPMTPALEEVLGRLLKKLWPNDFDLFPAEKSKDLLGMIEQGAFDLVVFTGGTSGARVFAESCARSLTPLIAEASGSEAAVVLPGVGRQELDQLVDHVLWGTFHHSGQTCVAPRFCFVPQQHAASFAAMAESQLEESREATTSRAPVKDHVSREHTAWCAWAKGQGAKEFSSTVRPEFKIFSGIRIDQLSPDSPATFGPALMVVSYDQLKSVVDWTRRSPWSLLTTVFGQPRDDAEWKILSGLDTSMISIGEAVTPVGDAAIPFGGRKQSGFGVTHGAEGLLAMTRVQTWVSVRSWPGLSMIRPSWRRLVKLNAAGRWLKKLEENPLNAAKEFFKQDQQKKRETSL